MATFTVKPKERINHTLTVPGDKSITHRSVMLLSLSEGNSIISNYLKADDTNRTITAFKNMGVNITEISDDKLLVEGVGIKGLKAPHCAIDAGNSGTTIRLLSGILAGQNFSCEIFGDESLSKRPMKRIIEPLRLMGVEISAKDDQYPPLKIKGNPDLKPIKYTMPVASAQVKSCIIFAGMQAKGETHVIEPAPSRDHTEKMLKYLGAKIDVYENKITIEGPTTLKAKDIHVPGDISSASYFLVAGLLVPNSEIEIKNVGFNKYRIGFLQILSKMGANIQIKNIENVCNETVVDIVASSSELHGLSVDQNLIPSMIDEIPLLVLVATQAKGTTIISGAEELRVKESDRIKTITTELNKMGAKITELTDGFVIEGKTLLHGAEVYSYNDHRVAMTLAIAGLIADGETKINNSECVNISFPGFWEILEKI